MFCPFDLMIVPWPSSSPPLRSLRVCPAVAERLDLWDLWLRLPPLPPETTDWDSESDDVPAAKEGFIVETGGHQLS